MKNFFIKLVNTVSNVVHNLFHLELEKEERQYRFVAEIKIAENVHYFGPFYTEEQLVIWTNVNHIQHLNIVIHDLHHPSVERSEWPI